MLDTLYFPNAPILNALIQTLLLLMIPLAISASFGSIAGIGVFFWRNPLFSRKTKPALFSYRVIRYFRSYGYLAFVPLFIILANDWIGITPGLSSILFITLGGIFFFLFHLHNGLNQLDASVLEGTLSTGLSKRWFILRVLLPLGKCKIAHALFDTALFILSMGSVSGILTGYGLSGTGRPLSSGSDKLGIILISYLLLALMFILIAGLSSRFDRKDV